MAPEQIEHPQEVDHRADIYSLGVVFYEMLTGELPVGKFQPPSQKVHVDVRLDEVVLRTLEKEPERRYQQASEVKTRLESIASTPPTPAPPGMDIAPSQPTSDKIILPAFLLAFFFGLFGMHRFYAGRIWSGLLQLGALLAWIPVIVAIVLAPQTDAPLPLIVCLGLLLVFMVIACLIWATVDWIVLACRAFTDGQGRRITNWLHTRGGGAGPVAAHPAVVPASSSGEPGKGQGTLKTLGLFAAVALMLFLVLGLGLFFFSRADFSPFEGGSTFGTNAYVAPQDNGETNLLATGPLTAEAPSADAPQQTSAAAAAPQSIQRKVTGGSETDLSKSFAVGRSGKLVMDVDRGGVRVVGADQDTVEVRVTRKVRRASVAEANRLLAEEKLVLNQSGSEVSIRAQEPHRLRGLFRWGELRPELDANYEISVPRKFELRLKDASGGFKVASIQGCVNINSLSGGLDLSDIEGKVDGGTMSGGIHAAGCRDELSLHSMSGGIKIESFTGPNVQANTASGSVSADFASAPKADCELHTMSGSVTARIPVTCAITVDAHTMNGGVKTDLPVQVEGRVHAGTLRGMINGGGPLLKLGTMSGGIELLRRGKAEG
jgi:hypothetical protein